jgi:hypothetical protein
VLLLSWARANGFLTRRWRWVTFPHETVLYSSGAFPCRHQRFAFGSQLGSLLLQLATGPQIRKCAERKYEKKTSKNDSDHGYSPSQSEVHSDYFLKAEIGLTNTPWWEQRGF